MKWAHWVATGFGAGYSPFFPGTVGSLVGFLLFWPLQDLSLFYGGFICVLLFGVGVYTADLSESFFNRKDASQIVIDEIVAMLLVLFLLPGSWGWRLAGFFLFRLFDILKPPPARRCEKLPGGWGVMLDDLWAAGYTVGVLYLFEAVLRRFAG